MPDVDLVTLADAGTFVSHEHQAHLAETVGLRAGRIDPATSTFVFTDTAGAERAVRAHLIGTASPEDGTWLWGWRNINGFPPAFVRWSERVRALGERYGIPELTTGTLPLDDGLPLRLVNAVKALTGVTAHVATPIGNGQTRAFLLLDDPSLALPPPTAARAVAVVTSALAGGEATDHRRALAAWAEQRGVPLTRVDTEVEQLTLTDGSLQVRFDASGRIAGLGRRLRGAPRPAPSPEPGPSPEPPRPAAAAAEPESEPPSGAEAPERVGPPPRRGLLQRLLGR
ncbi:DUF6882 domain-containing protein [uncultured Amnibacterium sp.]|uniref:DUF6882 domain-containing protein n=1 Tax=uncultured Amnibacterium sp. TaxID=1631851 RepID=UPI0035CA9182